MFRAGSPQSAGCRHKKGELRGQPRGARGRGGGQCSLHSLHWQDRQVGIQFLEGDGQVRCAATAPAPRLTLSSFCSWQSLPRSRLQPGEKLSFCLKMIKNKCSPFLLHFPECMRSVMLWSTSCLSQEWMDLR